MYSPLHLELAKAIATERQRQAATLRPALDATRGDGVRRRVLRAARAAVATTCTRRSPKRIRDDVSQRLIA